MKISSLVLAAVLGCAATSASAHAKLETSEPKASSVLAQAPQRIRLQFNESIEPAFSKVALTNVQGAEIAVKAVAENDKHKALAVSLPPLRAGEYRVRWTAMGHDGHKTKGEFSFTVK